MLRILVTHGSEEQIFPMPDTEARLGSSPKNDIALRLSGVSRRHARIRRVPGGIEVGDLGSKNGVRIEGQRVRRAVVTPGLRVQIGTAWLELQEVSTSEAQLIRLREAPSGASVRPSATATVEPTYASKTSLPSEVALALAFHVSQAGIGVPEERGDLLIRISACLGSEAFATFESAVSGRFRAWERVGTFTAGEVRLLDELAKDTITKRGEITLKRAGRILMAGRDSWFVAARFADERLASEGWRKEFMRFLGSQFFPPIRKLAVIRSLEVSRVFRLLRENVARTAELLGISRNTAYKLLERLGLPKR